MISTTAIVYNISVSFSLSSDLRWMHGVPAMGCNPTMVGGPHGLTAGLCRRQPAVSEPLCGSLGGDMRATPAQFAAKRVKKRAAFQVHEAHRMLAATDGDHIPGAQSAFILAIGAEYGLGL